MHTFLKAFTVSAAAIVSMLTAATPAQAELKELAAKGIKLSIDRKEIAVSGISSGAAMATQIHFAHSADLIGVGLVAGPPFRCADYMLGKVPPITADMVAINLCTAYYKKMPIAFTNPLVAGKTPELSRLLELADDAFNRKKVDPAGGLCGDRVMLVNGAKDETVPSQITGATAELYDALLERCDGSVKGKARVINVPEMPHTMPTDSLAEKKDCQAGAPYIADCDYRGAADMLAYLHRRESAQQKDGKATDNNLFQFSQYNAIGTTTPRGLLHKHGYVYVPTACQQGQSCALHIALHGCHQNEDQINKESFDPSRKYLFARDAGYNDFAERNNIVVLYPQADATGTMGGNPNGCWDWWGYNGVDYWQKGGTQIKNIWAIVNKL